MSIPTEHQNQYCTIKGHVLLILTKCGVRHTDQYVANIVFALLEMSYLVTIYTTDVNRRSLVNNVQGAAPGQLKFVYPLARLRMVPIATSIQMISLVMQLIINPPNPLPFLIITDTHTRAISLLRTLTSYRIIYLYNFPLIYTNNKFQPLPKAKFERSTVRALRHVDKIVVQTECLKQVLESCLSEFATKITVLNPCYDLGSVSNSPFDVRILLSKLPVDYILFAAFGRYKPRSNFEQLLEGFQYFIYYNKRSIVSRTRLVIAGYHDPLSALELTYFNALRAQAEKLPYKSNITFIEHTNDADQLSIITHCTAVLQPMDQSAHPGALLLAMNLKIPIVATDNGFAAEVLKNNVSGVLIDKMVDNKPAKFARIMSAIIKDPRSAKLLADAAKSEYDEKYSYFAFQQLVDSMITSPR